MKKVQLKVHISAVPLPGPSWGAFTEALRAPSGNTATGVRSPAQRQERLGQLLPKVAPTNNTNNSNLQAVAVPQGSRQTLLSPALPGEAEKLASAQHEPRVPQTTCSPTLPGRVPCHMSG